MVAQPRLKQVPQGSFLSQTSLNRLHSERGFQSWCLTVDTWSIPAHLGLVFCEAAPCAESVELDCTSSEVISRSRVEAPPAAAATRIVKNLTAPDRILLLDGPFGAFQYLEWLYVTC